MEDSVSKPGELPEGSGLPTPAEVVASSEIAHMLRRGAHSDWPNRDYHNRRWPHASLDRKTPDEAYFDHLPQRTAA